MKIKTADLIGPALDWAVAKCEGKAVQIHRNYSAAEEAKGIRRHYLSYESRYDDFGRETRLTYAPSTNPAQGQPILEREGITVRCIGRDINGKLWDASPYEEVDGHDWPEGPTMLIAGLRCWVASQLGDEIDVPEELLT